MKIRCIILFALALLMLPRAVPAAGLGDLVSNPDDVMLRKPAKPAVAPARDAASEKAKQDDAARRQAEAEAAARKASEEKAARESEVRQLREQVAAEKAAREKAEQAKQQAEEAKQQAEAGRKVAEAKAEAEKRAAEEAAEKASRAEKKAAYLANPDPDERPAPRKKLAPEGDQKDVTETLPEGGVAKKAPARKEKKSLTGRAAVITADRTDYDRKEGVILFDRNVYVDDEQYQMRAERLFVFLDGTNDLKRLVAIGGVTITNESKSAACARAVYTKTASRIVLYGDEQNPAWLRDAGSKKGDASEVRGLRITYWLDSGLATVEKSVITLPGIKGGAKDIFDMGKAGDGKKKADGQGGN